LGTLLGTGKQHIETQRERRNNLVFLAIVKLVLVHNERHLRRKCDEKPTLYQRPPVKECQTIAICLCVRTVIVAENTRLNTKHMFTRMFVAVNDKTKNLLKKSLGINFEGNISRREGLIMRKEIIPIIEKYV